MPPLPTPSFDTFLRHEALTALLQAYAAARPWLVELRSLGRSHEGRDIWLVVLTRRGGPPDTDKPALWVDGNIHAAELMGSTAVLYWLHALLSAEPDDAAVQRLLDTRTVYLCPRVNPEIGRAHV